MLRNSAKVRDVALSSSSYFFAIWLLVYAVVATNHEPWVDELQQINIALGWGGKLDLLQISYLEATPPYWFVMLKAVGSVFGVAVGLKVLGFLLASVTAFLWYRIETIPLWSRIGISYSLVIFFEHLVVVRVYAATLLLLVIYLWMKRNTRLNPYAENWREIAAICLLGGSSIWGAYLGALILLMGIARNVHLIRKWQASLSYALFTSASLLATQIGQGRNWPGQGSWTSEASIIEFFGNPIVALRNSLLPIPNADLESGTFALSAIGVPISALSALTVLTVLCLVFMKLERATLAVFLASTGLMTLHLSFIYLGGLRHWAYYFLMLGIAVYFSQPMKSRWARLGVALILSAQAASSIVIAGQDVFRSFSVGELLSEIELPNNAFIVALDDPANVMATFNLEEEEVYSLKGGEVRSFWLLNDEGQQLSTQLPVSCQASRKFVAITSDPPLQETSGSVSELSHGFNSTEDKLWVITWPACTADYWEEALKIAEN